MANHNHQPLVVAVQLVLTFQGHQLTHELRLPPPGEGVSFRFGRNHAFAGQHPYQQVGVVSGSHFVVHVHDDRTASITDSSSNGTFLNGSQLQRGRSVRLSDGDRITLIGPTSRVGLVEVKFPTPACQLDGAELLLVRRYVTLLAADESVQVQRERQRIDKELQQLTAYPLGDFDPKKKKEDSADSLSSGSLGAADGHNATLHFKAPIHIVRAKQHNKIRPGMKIKELPDPLPAPKPGSNRQAATAAVTPSPGSAGGDAAGSGAGSSRPRPRALAHDEVDPATQRYCLQRLNFAVVRAFHMTTGDRPAGSATVNAAASSSFATLLGVAARLDALEARLLGIELLQQPSTSAAAAAATASSSPVGAASTPTRRVDVQFLRDVRKIADVLQKVDASLLADAAFQQLLARPVSRGMSPSN